jgi:Holliday junction DNA helicase RuvA
LRKSLAADIITETLKAQLNKQIMIGKLTGRIDSSTDNHVIIDVNGVGYIAFCSVKTLSNLIVGEHTELLIETHVREDHIHLYGFYNLEEKSTFGILQSVKGVGTRMALAILSQLTPEEIQLALSAEDKAVFGTVSGVGKKLAERIITELKDKFITNISGTALNRTTNPGKTITNNIADDAISALLGLGVGRSEAQSRINTILNNSPDISINELIRLGLKNSN